MTDVEQCVMTDVEQGVMTDVEQGVMTDVEQGVMTDVEQGVMTDEHQSGHFAFRTPGQNETMAFYLTLQNLHVSIYEDE